jgi:catechol 2,3-dioxygenase-like lactoylglutathione lyase family enzyme
MFSHVMVGVSDLEASKKFYDAVLGAVGVPA